MAHPVRARDTTSSTWSPGWTCWSRSGGRDRQASRLRELAESYRRATLRTLRVAFLSALALELLATLSVALVAVSVGLRLVEGGSTWAPRCWCWCSHPRSTCRCARSAPASTTPPRAWPPPSEVFAVLEIPAGPKNSGPTAPDPSTEPLCVEDVRVDGRGGPVLNGLRLTVAPGELLGIRGPSGAGKSTLLDLLLGLRAPDAGRITVGGTDLADLDRDAWLRRVAWVPQRPVLLAGTVADNIALGEPGATPDRIRRGGPGRRPGHPVGHAGRRGRRRALHRPAPPGRAGPCGARRPAAAAARRAHRGRRRGHRGRAAAALPAVTAGRTTILISHRAEVLARCDRVIELPAPARPAVRAATGSPRPAPQERGRAAVLGSPRPTPSPPAPMRGGAGGGLRWSLRAARPERGRLALAALLGAGALGSGVALTATSAWLISTAALHPPVLTLMVAIVAVRTFGLGKGVLRYAERLVSHDAALRAGTELRVRIWTALVRIGPAATGRLRRGELLSRLITDVDAQQDLLVRVLLPATSAALVGLAASLGIGLLLPGAGLVLAAGIAVAGLIAPALTAWAAHRTERSAAAARGAVLARAVELLTAAPDLVVFGAGARYRAGLRVADEQLGRLLGRAALARGLGTGLGVLAIGATSVALTAVGIGALRSGQLSGPALAVLALTPLALADVVASLPEAAVRLLAARPAAERLAELEATPSAVPERPPTGPVDAPRSLAARGLAVRWPDADRDAVRGVDLDLGKHPRLALVGPSGSGKSTVVAALLRTLAPSAGQVLADGRDASRLPGDTVRRGISWCGPDTHLFDNTLRANLTLAGPAADDDELVADACAGPGWAAGSTACRTAWTPRSGSTAAPCPAVSGNASGWPGHCSRIDRSWCSTNRRRTSTRPPRTRSRPRSWPPPPVGGQ